MPHPTASKPQTTPLLTLAHSPDPDDAFMWWPLGDDDAADPKIDTRGLRFKPVTDDIESLNLRAIQRADLDVTAISIHTYPHVRDRYALTACGASMGEGYGPKVVIRPGDAPASPEDALDWLAHPRRRIAVPGLKTSAYLTLQIALGRETPATPMPFREVPRAVLEGHADAGLVIHESQLTFEQEGLALLLDLGDWWKRTTGGPLPLGGNVIRRDLDERFAPGTLTRVASALERSIRHALSRRRDALNVAHAFAPDADEDTTDRFVAMYVNDLTIDMGDRGRRAVEDLLSRGAALGLCPDPGEIDLIRGDDQADTSQGNP
jgi:1,4-dihydroxy-6-naphthoate synthase